jgi:hypothetical protein
MKRFLAFQGSLYYPSGGMDDFHADFDSLSEAIQEVVAHAQKENVHALSDLWRFSWAHVYDTTERRIVWTEADLKNNPIT